METTENLELPYIMPSQAQKHVTHNEAVRMLDALTQIAVLDMQLATPPATPEAGDRYRLPEGSTGVWAGKDGTIAAWQDGAWRFYDPNPGFVVWNVADQRLYMYDGLVWKAAVTDAEMASLPLLGLNASANVTNRLAVAAAASLFSHDGADHRLTINKASAADTASLLFQTDFSGRAEIGLTGDDRFHFKVSDDGIAFREAIVIDQATGAASFPATPCGMVNLLVNGAFAINQRGFGGGSLAAGIYGHDRMTAGAGGADYSVSAGIVSHAGGPLVQIIEQPNLAGKTVTFSIEDLASGDLTVIIEGETGTITPGPGRRKTTLVVPLTSTGDVTVEWKPASAAVSYKCVQLNEGGEAAAFERRHLANELLLCQRYFQKTYPMATAPGTASVFPGHVDSIIHESGSGGSALSSGLTRFQFSVPMRVAPTVVVYSMTSGAAGTGYNVTTAADIGADAANVTEFAIGSLRPTGAVTAGHRIRYHVTMDAEL